jgi:hypothetical protein
MQRATTRIYLYLVGRSHCIRRFISAGLLVSDVLADEEESDVVATDLGDLVAKKILSQL